MASISSTGIGSGLDVASIISQLVSLEKQPLKTLQVKADKVSAQVSALGQIKSQFSALQEVSTRLSNAANWSARTTSSSNTAAATVSATSTATATTFSLDIDALAKKQSVTSASYSSGALVGAGTMTFRLGTWTNVASSPGAADAALATANATLATAQSALTTATTNKATQDSLLATANSDLAAADADLVAPSAALAAANADLTAKNAALLPFTTAADAANTALTAANAALSAANTTYLNANSALTAADAAQVTASGNSTAANLALATAVTNRTNAVSASATANSALGIADSIFANATIGVANANSTLTSASAASTAANSSRDAALAADASAKTALASFAGSNPSAVDYSDAYGSWVDAVNANDHVTQAQIDAEATALVTMINARNALGVSNPSVLALANVETAPADASDASALKGAALSAANAVSNATTAQTDANAALATATSDRATALSTATAAANALVTATDDHATAFAAATAATTALTAATNTQTAAAAAAAAATTALGVATADQAAAMVTANAATADLVAPTADQAQAQADVAAATAALAPLTATRSAASAAQLAAAAAAAVTDAAFTSATDDVTNANALVLAATTAATTARPVFTAASGSADVNVTVTAADTVTSLVEKINAANAGVVASVYYDASNNQSLRLISKDTGAEAGFRVLVTDTGDSVDTDSAGLSRLAYDPQSALPTYGIAGTGLAATFGQDARARIDGLVVTSKTNTLTSLNHPGVTVSLLATTTTGLGTPGEVKTPVSVAVKEDVTVAVKNVGDFVDAYNKLVTSLKDMTKYDPATKTASLFQADSAVVGMLSMLRSMVGTVSSGSAYQRLSEAGIGWTDSGTAKPLNGTLSLSTTKLSVAANNGTELQKLFTTDNSDAATNGFALKFAALAKNIIDGAEANKETALANESKRIVTEQNKVNDRAAAVEARLRKQYSALDAKMAGLTALNQYVAQQVTAWNKSTG